jgi:ATP-dependent Clp protease ATP-binding subunit ClpA
MFDRFTDRARMSMVLSRKAAERFGHNYVGTEHLLLCVIEEGGGCGFRALERCGAKPDAIANDVATLLKRETPAEVLPQLPFTDRTKIVLGNTIRTASRRGHDFVDTGHLLIGLFQENEGLAAQVLLNHGLTEKELLLACGPFWIEQILYDFSLSQSWGEKLCSTIEAWCGVRLHQFISSSHGLFYGQLTDEGAVALEDALLAADALEQDFIGTEHLLVALAGCGPGRAATAFATMGLTQAELLSAVRNLAASSKKETASGDERKFPWTPRAKTALVTAGKAAAALNRDFIGAEHLLIGVLADSANSARGILKQLGVDRTRLEVAMRVLQKF